MILSIVTLFPDLYLPFIETSLIGRARAQGHVDINLAPMFSYAAAGERIDAPSYGHGAGMLIKPSVVERAIEDQEQTHGSSYKIFFSPQGEKLDQDLLKEIFAAAQQRGHMMLIPARYEGMDARVEKYYADKVVSIGDYVLMGGDLPAMVLMEGMLRLLPGVVGKQESVEKESFSGAFVDYPEYTEPLVWKGEAVPEVIRSGHHKQIEQWREREAAQKSVLEHFDWVRSHELTTAQELLVREYIPPHYAVLMHSNVMLPQNREGTTSVTSLDIHDIARSACTYGLKGYFIVTPLEDQQKIVKQLLNFWESDVGRDYNGHRHEALRSVHVVTSLDEVLSAIAKIEGKQPIVMGTSARQVLNAHHITFYDQKKVWHLNRPVLILFGTGQGLAASALDRCDFILPPVRGFTSFNHLSVRSAAAIIFDRWLGNSVKKRKTIEGIS